MGAFTQVGFALFMSSLRQSVVVSPAHSHSHCRRVLILVLDWKNVCWNTLDYLTHHPNMWSIPAAVVWDAMTNAGGAISQDNTI